MLNKLTVRLFSLVLVMSLLTPVLAQEGTTTTSSDAQTILLNNATTSDSTTWFITGEPSLVMNGFDLTPLNLTPPIFVKAIRIAVVRPVPGITIDAVLYADDTGGSPIDARIVAWERTTIDSAGVARIEFPEPVMITSPVVWAGFYLPVDFRFRADTSGSSVLTYWAWQPAGVFDLANLTSAAVFGPADGSAPVNIDMGGVARITIEVMNPAADPDILREVAPIGVQITAPPNASLSNMTQYSQCSGVSFDHLDIAITARFAFTLNCRTDIPQDGPGLFWNFERVQAGIESFVRPGRLYDITPFGDYRLPDGDSTALRVPVTHCLAPDIMHLEDAVLAVAYGAPQRWKILPTVRYGNVICAELTHAGSLAYLVPRDPSEESLNANLYFTGTGTVFLANEESPEEGRTTCGRETTVRFNIRNDGFEFTPATQVRLQNVALRTGEQLLEVYYDLPALAPGETITRFERFTAPNVYLRERHRIILMVDPANIVAETNENDNVHIFEYQLDCPE